MTSDLKTYGDLIRATATRHGRREALVFPDSRLTYAELLERATARVDELRATGVGRGDRFGVLMPNGSTPIELLIGGALLGAITVPLDVRFQGDELHHLTSTTGLKAIFTTLGGSPLGEMPEQGGRGTSPTADDTVMVVHTSGTTSRPRACRISHRAFVMNAPAIARRFELVQGDGLWNPLPMSHMSSLLLMSAVFVAGGRFISMARFDPGRALDQIERERPTILYPVFPTVTQGLIRHPRFSEAPLEHVRCVCSVGPEEVQRQVQAAFPDAALVNAYGSTELCNSLAYSEPADSAEERATTCGRPLPHYEVKVVDAETGGELVAGERGELVARGPSVFSGYDGASAPATPVLDADGFFHTGDLCSIDAAGRLKYHGRLADMLSAEGQLFPALEIESVLATHPAIKLAQALDVDLPGSPRAIAAFVELVPDASLTPDEVLDFCARRLPPAKVPLHVRFVKDWPMSTTKVQKFRLREQLADEHSDDMVNRT